MMRAGMPHYSIDHHEFISFDGTRLGYQIMGEGKQPVVLCNGLGGTAVAWRPLVDSLGDSYRFITWDYRGLFRSDPPKNLSALTIPDHARDLVALLKHLKIKKAVIGGWSMGVQVALEFYRLQPGPIVALVLINGTHGYPFDTALGNPLLKYVLPTVNDLAKKIVPRVQGHIQPLAHKIINWEGFVTIITNLGLVHKTINQEIIREVAVEMMGTDLGIYHEILECLSQHDAWDVLPKIQVPTLIITGTEDRITPVSTAEEMADHIPHSQLFVVPKGSHYTLLEFPEEIVLRLGTFLEEHYKSRQK